MPGFFFGRSRRGDGLRPQNMDSLYAEDAEDS